MAFFAPIALAIFNVSFAPFKNSSVTSFPDMLIIFPSIPSKTSLVFPINSAGSLGVESPPNCSGQTNIAFSSLNNSKHLLFKLFLPLYLQFTPHKHALIKYITQLLLIYNLLLDYTIL